MDVHKGRVQGSWKASLGHSRDNLSAVGHLKSVLSTTKVIREEMSAGPTRVLCFCALSPKQYKAPKSVLQRPGPFRS